MDTEPSKNTMLVWTTQIVSSHLRKNVVPVEELPTVINSIYRTLKSAIDGPSSKEEAKPAVAIRRSVTPDYIVCLEDGKKLKMLKRHLRTVYNLSPEEYRQKWGLAPDYPMVAPNYAVQRRTLAKKIGLGKKRSSGAAN